MTQLLVEKGAGLIRSFEAGARTGMMGMGWVGVQIQRLLEETAQQPDILYLVVTDKTGMAVAHSDSNQISRKHGSLAIQAPLVDADQLRWHQVRMDNDMVAFEVYKPFEPVSRRPGPEGSHHRMMIQRHGRSQQDDGPPWQRPFCGPRNWCRPYCGTPTAHLPVRVTIFSSAWIWNPWNLQEATKVRQPEEWASPGARFIRS